MQSTLNSSMQSMHRTYDWRSLTAMLPQSRPPGWTAFGGTVQSGHVKGVLTIVDSGMPDGTSHRPFLSESPLAPHALQMDAIFFCSAFLMASTVLLSPGEAGRFPDPRF